MQVPYILPVFLMLVRLHADMHWGGTKDDWPCPAWTEFRRDIRAGFILTRSSECCRRMRPDGDARLRYPGAPRSFGLSHALLTVSARLLHQGAHDVQDSLAVV